MPEGVALPHFNLPEIAFWGRSNCGKSSLLNRLVQQKQLARVSRTPGRTQALNFFNLAQKLILVDMPGYGFTKGASMKHEFSALSYHYLTNRRELRLLCLLIDARRGIMDTDRDIMKLLSETGTAILLIITKQDAIIVKERDMLQENIAQEIATIPNALQESFFTSATKNDGFDELQKRLALML